MVPLFLVLIYKSTLKKEEIIKQHYSTEEVAGKYNLNYFPFVSSDKRKKHTGKNLELELAGSKNREVIRNLKIYFTQELLVNVEAEVAANLKGRRLKMVEEAHRCIEVSVQLGKGAPYLYYISFSDKSFKVCYVVHWGRSWPIIIIITTSLDKLFPPFLSTYSLLMSIFRAFLNPLLLLPTELPILRNH